jgi:GNAT superfamily N-acetyltransferase
MRSEVTIEFVPKDLQKSEYDWVNIAMSGERVGKARCKIDGDTLIIYSINIFPEFEGRGFGKAFVEFAKLNFKRIIADRVRFSAIGFWEKLGFVDNKDGNWIYERK